MYGTVRTVVWEDGKSNNYLPPIRLVNVKIVYMEINVPEAADLTIILHTDNCMSPYIVPNSVSSIYFQMKVLPGG